MVKRHGFGKRAIAVRLQLLGLAAAAAVPAAPGFAQGEGVQRLEEVVVSASRRDESLQDVALAVSVLDPGRLVDAGLTSLPEILTFVPGVSVVDTGGPFNNSVYMRGINAVLAAGVATYVDEIPFGSSTVYTTPAPLDGTLLDLGTLDVMKGPQGTLWGASAMGGILKFNTRKASPEAWTGNVSVDLSDTEGGGLNELYRVNLNGPLIEDKLAVSLTGFSREKSGYIDNVALGIDGWDDYEYEGGSGSLRWTPTERLDVTLQGLYQSSTQSGLARVQANHADDALQPGIAAGEPWFGMYETGDADVNPSEFEARLLGLTVNYDFDFATLTYVTSTQELSFEQSIDVTVPFASFADIFFPDNAPHTSAVLVGELGFDKDTHEVRLTSASDQALEWIVGAFYSTEEGFNIQDLVLTPSDPLYFGNFPSDYEELSLFGNLTYRFTDTLDGSIGVRYSDYENDVELQAIGPLLAPLERTVITDTVTSYLFNLRYRPSDRMSLYARAASGYRPGGANFVLRDPATGAALTNDFFKPDSLWSYEVGAKGSSADGRFTYDLAAFYIDWQDYQIQVTRDGLTVASNAEKAISQGLEASFSVMATEALTLRGMLSYTNAELAADVADLGGADGDQLPNSPEWSASLDAEYRVDLGAYPSYLGVSWRYKDDMPVGFEGYTDAGGTFRPPSAPRVELDSYHLVDLRAGTSVGPVDIALYVTNLFDEAAFTHFIPSFSAASTGTPTRPRTLGAVVKWNFL